jgi:hypothetical protein
VTAGQQRLVWVEATLEAIATGMNVNAVPAPATMNGRAGSRRNARETGTWVAHSTPAPIRDIPIAMTIFAPPRVTSLCERPATATHVMDVASHATPVWSAL